MIFFKVLPFATKLIANNASPVSLKPVFYVLFGLVLVSGCSIIDKPTRASLYDFGPVPLSAPGGTATVSTLPPLVIADIATSGGALDNQGVLYRLAYADAQQLRPYSQARWSMLPAQLVRQRLRERLSQRRVVLNAREGVALNRVQNASLPMLRLELEEFSQLFSAPDASVGLIRLHATLVDITPAGEKLVGQRSFGVQRPASSADAPGGVRALTEATEAAIEEIEQWLLQMPAR